MKRIHLFRTGTHTPMKGEPITFSEADLAACAAAYDPKLHEAPIVVGHPKDNAPAFGWVSALFCEGGDLEADPAQVDPAFAELVEAGRYKKVSASFYLPDDPANPKPGGYYLRHIGFLGAQPPAIKGLREIGFAAGDEGTVEIELDFSEGIDPGRGVSRLAKLLEESLRRLRDWFIGKYGQEEADRVLPSWNDQWAGEIASSVAKAEDPFIAYAEAEAAAFAELIAAIPAGAAPALPEAVQVVVLTPEQEAAFAEREGRIAAREAKIRKDDAIASADRFVAAGQLAPGIRDEVAAFMERLDDDNQVAFSEGAGAKTETLRAFFERLLGSGKTVIDFSEAAPTSKREPTPGDKTARLARRARELVHEAVQSGRTLSFAEAVGMADREEESQ